VVRALSHLSVNRLVVTAFAITRISTGNRHPASLSPSDLSFASESRWSKFPTDCPARPNERRDLPADRCTRLNNSQPTKSPALFPNKQVAPRKKMRERHQPGLQQAARPSWPGLTSLTTPQA